MQTTINTTISKTLYGIMLAGMVFAVIGMSGAPNVRAQEDRTETPTSTTETTPVLAFPYVSEEVAFIPNGKSTGQIEIIPGREEQLPTGPSAVSVDNIGNIYIIDPLNYHVVKLSTNGHIVDDISYDTSVGAMDIAIISQRLYLLDGRNGTICEYGLDGQLIKDFFFPQFEQLNQVATSESGKLLITGLLKTADISAQQVQPFAEASVSIDVASDQVSILDLNTSVGTGTRRGAFSVNLRRNSNTNGTIEVKSNLETYLLGVNSSSGWDLGSADIIDFDRFGNLFVLITSITQNNGGSIQIDFQVAKYNPQGDLISNFDISDSSYTYPNKKITVDENGNIYQLVTEPSGTHLIRWTQHPIGATVNLSQLTFATDQKPITQGSSSAISCASQQLLTTEVTPNSHSEVTILSITRDQVIANANSYASHTWTVGSNNHYGRTCSNGCPVGDSWWSIGTSITGVAYQWGGFDTVSEFDTKLSQGYIAGDVTGDNCTGNCATGIDCSGFVARVWNVSAPYRHYYNTNNIQEISTPINWSDLKMGDILNKYGSHVVLFYYWDSSGAPVFYESTWDGVHNRVILNTQSGYGKVGNYTPLRYNNITDGDDGGTGLDCGQVSYNGVILYENKTCNKDVNGRTKQFSFSTGWIDIVSDFNDITSSIYVGNGWSVKIFENDIASNGGSWRCITGSMWDLSIDYYTNGNTGKIINDDISSVQVYNNNSCNGGSAPSTPSLSSPSDGATYANPQSVTFSWSSSGDSYSLIVTGGPSAQTVSPTTNSYTLNSMWPGVYQWYVKAYRNGQWSNQSSTWTLNMTPGAPGSVNVTTNSTSAVTVNWSDSAGGVDGYRIYRNGSLVSSVGSSTHNYQVTGLPCGNTSTYTVRGFKGSLESPDGTASGSTDACPQSVYVVGVFTTDQNGTASALGEASPTLAGDVLTTGIKTNFNAGDGIQLFIEVNNPFVTDQTAYFRWTVLNPSGQHVSALEWSGNLNTPSGDIYWLLPTTIPPDSLTGDYTFTGSITYNGSTTSASTTFHVNALTYTITGNAGESGVTLRYTDGTAKSITSSSNGRYTITVPYNWSGSITPSKTGLTFSPTSKSYSHITANQASQNYSAVMTISSTGSYDGYILESTETSNIGGSVNATNTYFVLGDASADRQYRAILAFNTASLPDTATIQSVVVKIKQYGSPVGTNPFSILGSLYTDIRKGYFGTSVSLQTTDFNAAASTTSVAATFGKTPVSGWYSATLTSTGRSYVNKTSWTELRLRFSKDDDDDGAADYMKFYSGNYSTSSYRPQLVVTYTLP